MLMMGIDCVMLGTWTLNADDGHRLCCMMLGTWTLNADDGHRLCCVMLGTWTLNADGHRLCDVGVMDV